MYQVSRINMKIINKVALAVFRKKKVLMVRSAKQAEVFYSLGGKIKEGESDVECLKREVWEEIGCQVDFKSLQFLAELQDVAHGKEHTQLNLRLYSGQLIGKPKPSSEVVEISYFDTKTNQKYLSTFAQRTLFPWLKAHGYIR